MPFLLSLKSAFFIPLNQKAGSFISIVLRALIHPVEIRLCIRNLSHNLENISTDCICRRLCNRSGYTGRRKYAASFCS